MYLDILFLFTVAELTRDRMASLAVTDNNDNGVTQGNLFIDL